MEAAAIPDSPSFEFDSPSEQGSDASYPCVLDRFTPLQAERLICSLDAQLAKLAEELRDAEPESSDACLIEGEIATYKQNKAQLVERLISAPQKRKLALPSEDEADLSPAGSQVSTRSARRREADRRPIRPVRAPKREEWFMEIYHDFMNLWELSPPVESRLVRARSVSASMYTDMEEIGKYLVDRGFPLLGVGSVTLTFLLTPDWVAKVARYGWDSGCNASTVRHFQERNRDLMMHATYPTCFAESRLAHVPLPRHDRLEDGTWWRTIVEDRRLYIQERLYGPFIYEGLDEEHIESQADNAHVLREFIRNHPDPNPVSTSPTILKQWAYTKAGKLVCFDYI